MYQITTDEIQFNILNEYIPQDLREREELIKRVNTAYQWGVRDYINFQKGDYSFIKKLLEAHIYKYY